MEKPSSPPKTAPGDTEPRQQPHPDVVKTEFMTRYGDFPAPAREFLADLSSVLLEQDVRANFINDPEAINGFNRKLQSLGIDEKDMPLINRYFNFPALTTGDEIAKE